MKRFLGLALGTLLLAGNSSCKKEAGPSEIFGDWQWVSSTGGFTGKQVHTPASTNLSRTVSFRRDSMFVECDNGRCTLPAKFTSRMERSYLTGKPALILTFRRRIYLAPPDTGFHIILDRYSVIEVSNTLRIDQDGPDGFVEIYQRK
ncbi:MAG: hypothetical protein ACRYF0_13285 [Janthinobacterium lividum]